jgi:outer membrane lipoprotein-sorting protein
MPYIPTMPKNRIFPALGMGLLIPLVALAQAPSQPLPPAGIAAPSTEPLTEAETQLEAAIKQVAALKSVSSDVLQKVDMLDQKFVIRGRYLKAPNRRVYLQLTVEGLPDATGTMLQVCDGTTLWDYQQVLESQAYRKMEVAQVFEKLKSPEIDEALREQVISQLGFAGPEELLKGLRKSVKFDQKTAASLDGMKVWVLRGEWRNRQGLLGPNQQALPPTMTLPAYVPSLVVVTIGQADGWPYKVLLVGKVPSLLMDTRQVGPDGRPIGARSSIQEVKPTRIELTYGNVKLNPDLKIEEFVFQAPPGARVEDNTLGVVGMLDQAIQVRIAQKRAEAAKADGPILNQPIDVNTPKPGVSTPEVSPAQPPKSR